MRQVKAMRRTGRTLPNDKNKQSFEVPRIYTEATKILKQHEEENVPLKTLMQKCNLNLVKRKKLHDLLAITVKNKTAIKTAIRKAKFFKKEQNFDPLLARIIAADLMVKGKLEDQSKVVQTVLKYKEKLMNRLDTRIDIGNEEEMEDALPIYTRVNTLLCPIADVHTKLSSEGYTLQELKPKSYDEYLSQLQDMGIKSYMQDYHIEGLLVFPPNSSIKDSSVYKEKAIILQDKASCLPVFLSDVKTLENVIEACAGAGHQASQIAAVMHNTGDILALERDKAQYEVARGLIKSSGATNVTCKNDDFTLLQGEKHPDVEHIFVNAPCSATCADEFAENRIIRFASFQAHLLKSALEFPSVKEVIYSTVSVNKKENEDVVKLALDAYGYLYELEDLSKKLDGWKHFGQEGYDFSSRCLRTETGVDKVGSLFVAKFVRKEHPDPKPVKEKNLKRKRFTPAVTVDDNDESMEVVEIEEENEEDYPSKKRRRH